MSRVTPRVRGPAIRPELLRRGAYYAVVNEETGTAHEFKRLRSVIPPLNASSTDPRHLPEEARMKLETFVKRRALPQVHGVRDVLWSLVSDQGELIPAPFSFMKFTGGAVDVAEALIQVFEGEPPDCDHLDDTGAFEIVIPGLHERDGAAGDARCTACGAVWKVPARPEGDVEHFVPRFPKHTDPTTTPEEEMRDANRLESERYRRYLDSRTDEKIRLAEERGFRLLSVRYQAPHRQVARDEYLAAPDLMRLARRLRRAALGLSWGEIAVREGEETGEAPSEDSVRVTVYKWADDLKVLLPGEKLP